MDNDGYRLVTDLSLIGISLGVILSVFGFFNAVTCTCPLNEANCSCQLPFSYYLYSVYLPSAIIGVSAVVLVWSLRVQKRFNAGRSHQ
jgi:hypothetical protein